MATDKMLEAAVDGKLYANIVDVDENVVTVIISGDGAHNLSEARIEASLSADAETVDLPYHCDVCTTPGYGDTPCSPLCDRQKTAPSASVLPLKWKEDHQRNHAYALFGGCYTITEYKGMMLPFSLEARGFSGSLSRYFVTIDEAKAAAQADYQARIRRALA